MKKIIFTLLCLLFQSLFYSQYTPMGASAIYISGRALKDAGILLNVKPNEYNVIRAIQSNSDISAIHFFSPTWQNGNTSRSSGAINLSPGHSITFGSWDNPFAFFRSSDGYVGFGTTNPQSKLHVNGTIIANGFLDVRGSDLILGKESGRPIGNKPNQRALVHYIDDKLFINYTGDFEGGTFLDGHKTVITGNLGIGTQNPDEKLTVNGNIHAREVKVDLKIPADYVFQQYYTGASSLNPEYQFPTLQETEQFIKQNHYLPQIPSSLQIQEQGLKVGEMTNLLLQKIEELTLYIIEQNKILQQQEKQINAYDLKNNELETQLEIQKSELKQLTQSIKDFLSVSTQR